MTLLLGFSAVNTGNNLLYLLVAALLGFMAISGLLGQQNLKGVRAEIVLPEEIYAGVPTLVSARIWNRRRWMPGFLLRLELPDGGALFPVVESGGELSRPLPLTPVRRGWQELPPLRVSSCFPVGFFVRSRQLHAQPDVLVFPPQLRCSTALACGEWQDDDSPALPRYGTSGELQSIGDYQGVESPRDIHWKLSARHDNLKVKRLGNEGRKPLWLDPAQIAGKDLEERLGRCCYLVNHLLGQHQPVGLRLPDKTIAPGLGPSHRLRLLRELALL
ncbi:MAG: DUF58 domain-containing protein [Desulfuromonadales bacterium]|nr:DUF58 domain-containing protein [Desulfuromonadales bacterium]